MEIAEAKAYLERMERDRSHLEQYNKRAYADARELSAMLSLAEFGNVEIKKKAEKVINSI